jgi:hypothetical protein
MSWFYVYGVYAAGVLQYIGSSNYPPARFKAHKRAAIGDELRFLKRFTTRKGAYRYEAAMIWKLKPARNISSKLHPPRKERVKQPRMERKTMPSRQAEFQRRRRSLNLCAQCGEPSGRYRCAACRADQAVRMRAKHGYSPQRAGGRGRPVAA